MDGYIDGSIDGSMDRYINGWIDTFGDLKVAVIAFFMQLRIACPSANKFHSEIGLPSPHFSSDRPFLSAALRQQEEGVRRSRESAVRAHGITNNYEKHYDEEGSTSPDQIIVAFSH